jgi:hypothetical protein
MRAMILEFRKSRISYPIRGKFLLSEILVAILNGDVASVGIRIDSLVPRLFQTLYRGGMIRMIRYLAATFAIAVSVSLAPYASASIEMATDPSVPGGTNNLTRDTSTGLEWLDWTASTGISFNDMQLLLDPGSQFEGYRHATRQEVGVFFESLGLPVGLFPSMTSVKDGRTSANFAALHLGATDVVTLEHFTSQAITADDGPIPSTSLVVVFGGGSSIAGDPSVSSFTSGVANIAIAASELHVGHALVRDPVAGAVPEPTSVICWGGLALAFASLRKRRKLA